MNNESDLSASLWEMMVDKRYNYLAGWENHPGTGNQPQPYNQMNNHLHLDRCRHRIQAQIFYRLHNAQYRAQKHYRSWIMVYIECRNSYYCNSNNLLDKVNIFFVVSHRRFQHYNHQEYYLQSDCLNIRCHRGYSLSYICMSHISIQNLVDEHNDHIYYPSQLHHIHIACQPR